MARTKKRHDDIPSHEDSSQGSGSSGDSFADRDRVAARAYELYLARGGADGLAWDDWLAAERELSAPPGDSPGSHE